MSTLESAEEFHARVAAATDDEGRLPVAIELMPGWAMDMHGFGVPAAGRPAIRLGALGVGRLMRWALR